jgi:hypothetical protein
MAYTVITSIIPSFFWTTAATMMGVFQGGAAVQVSGSCREVEGLLSLQQQADMGQHSSCWC